MNTAAQEIDRSAVSRSYVASLRALRAREAALADRMAYRISTEHAQLTPEMLACAIAEMHAVSHRRDRLTQQIAWLTRESASVYPCQPAWCD